MTEHVLRFVGFQSLDFLLTKKTSEFVCLFGLERTKPRSQRLVFFLCAYNVT